MDLSALDARTLLERSESIIARATECGIPSRRIALWLRSLDVLPSRRALDWARTARAMTNSYQAPLVIGARPDLALLCGADAVHITHSGPSARDVQRLMNATSSSLLMSAAVHDPAEAREHAPLCNVLLASPFGVVPHKNAPLGIAGLSAIVAAAPARSVLALGGIDTAAAVHAVFAAGARGIAVRRALLTPAAVDTIAPLLQALAMHIA